MNRYDSPLTPEQIAAVKDEEIDFSDIPELDEDFWREAELKLPDRTEQVTLRVKAGHSESNARRAVPLACLIPHLRNARGPLGGGCGQIICPVEGM